MQRYKWVGLVGALLLSGPGWATSGNTLPRPSASALGTADANVALATGPSSQFINPANLAVEHNDHPSWEAGTLLGYITSDLRRPAGGRTPAEDNTPIVPYAAVARWWSAHVAVGFSVELPHGLGNEWPDRSFEWVTPLGAVDIAQMAELQVVRFGPAVALKLDERWAIGGRLFAQHVRAQENNDLYDVEGDGTSLGAQLGLRYALDNVILGAAYTTRTRTEIEGSISNVHPVAASSLIAGDATADILLPARLQAGIALRVAPNVWWELDLDWIEWAYVDELTIVQANGTVANAGKNKRHNRNTLSVRTGGKWTYSPRLTLYAGLGYDPTPTAERDATPISGLVRKTRIALGATHHFPEARLDIAYQFVRGHSRRVRESDQDNFKVGSSVVDTGLYEGTYDNRAHIIGVSYIAEF